MKDFWKILATVDSIDMLTEEKNDRLCIDSLREEFGTSLKFSTLVKKFSKIVKSDAESPIIYQIGQFWNEEGKEIENLKFLIRDFVCTDLIELLKKWEDEGYTSMSLNEISILKQQLRYMRDIDSILEAENQEKVDIQGNFDEDLEDDAALKLIEDIELRNLALMKNPDIVSQTSIISYFCKLSNLEREMTLRKLKIFQEKKFESILTQENILCLTHIEICLQKITETLQQKKIRSISPDDLTQIIAQTYQNAEEEAENPSVTSITLSQKIGKIIQTAFFNSTTSISQNIIDMLENILSELKEFYKSKNRQNSLRTKLKMMMTSLFTQTITSGDLIIFNDVLIPLFTTLSTLIPSQKLSSPIEKIIENGLSQYQPLTYTRGQINLLVHLNSQSELINQFLAQFEVKLLLLSNPEKRQEIDLATKVIKLQRSLDKAIVNEYTKEAVENNKKREREEIRELFGDEEDLEFRGFWETVDKEDHIRMKKRKKFLELRGEKLKYLKVIFENLNGFDFENEEFSLKRKLRLECQSALICLGNDQFNQTIMNERPLKKLVKNRISEKLEEILDETIFEIKDLSIFSRVDKINSTTDITKIWQEQMLQLIEVDQKGFYTGSEKEELIASQQVFSKLLLDLRKVMEDEMIRGLPILNQIMNGVA